MAMSLTRTSNGALILRVHREHDHGGRRRLLAHQASDLETVEPRHRHVHDQRARLEALDEADDLEAVRGLADHLQVLFHLDQAANTAANQVLMVGEYDGDRR